LFKSAWDWITDLDYGSVPGWLAGFSLLLAFRIFRLDRRAAERAQVDLIGVWLHLDYERAAPIEAKRVETGKYTLFVRNSSATPVEVVQVACRICTKWMVRDLAQWREDLPIWDIKPGTGNFQMYTGPVRVPPGETWDSGPHEFNFAHLAPEHADQIDLSEGLSYEIRWVLLIDSSGRRWEVRPMAGGPARPITWWSRRRRDYPVKWKNRATYWLAVQYHKLRARMQA
jgi:hypothetical protein